MAWLKNIRIKRPARLPVRTDVHPGGVIPARPDGRSGGRSDGFVFVLLFLSYLLISQSFLLADTNWQVLKTEYFEVFYKSGYESKAKECLAVLEAYRDHIKKLTGCEIPKLRVVIENIGTESNAFADNVNPNIHIYTYPPQATMSGMPGIGFGENWWRIAGTHESIHMAQLNQTKGIPKILTTLFGNYFSPNMVVPGWIAEGVTVSGESQLSPYEGRINDGFYDAVLQAFTDRHPFPSLLDMTYNPLNFPSIAGGPYLYGGLFLNHLRDKYGQDKLNEFFNNQGGLFFGWLLGWLFPYVGIDDAAKMTFGKSFNQLLDEWKDYYMSHRKPFAIDGNPLTSDKLTLYSNLFTDDNYLYYVKEYFKKTGAYNIYAFKKIMRYDVISQQEQEIVNTTSYFSAAPQIVNNQLYYNTLDYQRGFANSTNRGFGFISNLHCKNLATSKNRIILSDEIRSFLVRGNNHILYTKDRKDKFGSEIWLFDTQTKQKQLLLESDYLIDQMVSDGNYIVVCAKPDWQNWGIYLFDINNLSFESIINTPYNETTPSISNNKIFFVANYDKTYRIYSYDLTNKKLYQVTTGSYAHFPVIHKKTGELYFTGLDSDGTNLYHKPAIFSEIELPKYKQSIIPDLSRRKVGIPKATSLDNPSGKTPNRSGGLESVITPTQGGYGNVMKTMVPSFRFPLISSKKPGAVLAGSDVTYEHYYETRFRFGESPYLSLLYENTFLPPMTIGIQTLRKEGERDNTLYANYPLLVRLEPGISSIWPLLEIRSDEEKLYTHNELVPDIQTAIKYPKWQLQNQLNYIIERKNWDSEIDRNALESTTVFSHYLTGYTGEPEWGSELMASLYLINDPDKTESQEITIRGYSAEDTLKTKRGGTFTLEYSFPILKGRDGSWNPNIYRGDFALAGFGDVAFGEGNSPLYSGGVEFRLEAALGLYITFIPVIGIAFNKDGENSLYLSFLFASSRSQGISIKHTPLGITPYPPDRYQSDRSLSK
ncbi:MAG: hypothetical protein V1871_06260 [Planctomycetota bacterium]